MVCQRQVAVCEEFRVAWVIVLGVERFQLFVCKSRHLLWVASRIIDVWEDVMLISDVKQISRIRHLSLHLIVYNPLEDEVASLGNRRFLGRPDNLGVLGADAPPFLDKIRLLKKRVQGGVEVDRHQVLEVLGIGGGKGVEGVVGRSKGVHEVGKRSREHFEEWIANRVSMASQEHTQAQQILRAVVYFRLPQSVVCSRM